MDHDDLYDKTPGTYKTKDPKVIYKISEYMSSTTDRPFEYHKNHSDVVVVLSGQELLSTTWRELKSQTISYDEEKGTFKGLQELSTVPETAGSTRAFFLTAL